MLFSMTNLQRPWTTLHEKRLDVFSEDTTTAGFETLLLWFVDTLLYHLSHQWSSFAVIYLYLLHFFAAWTCQKERQFDKFYHFELAPCSNYKKRLDVLSTDTTRTEMDEDGFELLALWSVDNVLYHLSHYWSSFAIIYLYLLHFFAMWTRQIERQFDKFYHIKLATYSAEPQSTKLKTPYCCCCFYKKEWHHIYIYIHTFYHIPVFSLLATWPSLMSWGTTLSIKSKNLIIFTFILLNVWTDLCWL